VRHALLLVLLAALVAHGVGLRGGFVYDDHRFIEANSRLAAADLAGLLDPGTQTSDSDRDVWRPLRALGHRLDLQTGLGPFAFHLHSLAAHLAAVALGWLLLRRLLPEPSEAPALLGAMLLAVHPLAVEVVGWASSRGDLYAVAFGFAALLAALQHGRAEGRGVRAAWLVGAGLLAFLAFLGKESAAWVPLVALLARRLLGRPAWRAVLALGLGVAAGLLLRQWSMAGISPVQTAAHGGPVERVAWSLYGTGLTLAHALWPAGLSVDYVQDQWIHGTSAWLRGWTLLGAAAVAGAVLLRKRWPLAAFLLSWVLLAWLPSSSLLVTLRMLVNDRGAYPLLLPLGALAGVLLLRRPAAALAAAVGLAVLLVPLTVARTQAFHDDASLWLATLRAQPRSVTAVLGLAYVVGRTDRQEQGRLLQQAVALAPPGGLQSGIAGAQFGEWLLRVADKPEQAEPVLRQSVQLLRNWRDRSWPRNEEGPAVAALAEALTRLGRHDEADALLLRAVAEQPKNAMLLVQRSGLAIYCWQREHGEEDLQIAVESWRAADRLAPDDAVVQALGRRIDQEIATKAPVATEPQAGTPEPGG
jgi:hypothetical protein